jgi:hypothetical protein
MEGTAIKLLLILAACLALAGCSAQAPPIPGYYSHYHNENGYY